MGANRSICHQITCIISALCIQNCKKQYKRSQKSIVLRAICYSVLVIAANSDSVRLHNCTACGCMQRSLCPAAEKIIRTSPPKALTLRGRLSLYNYVSRKRYMYVNYIYQSALLMRDLLSLPATMFASTIFKTSGMIKGSTQTPNAAKNAVPVTWVNQSVPKA